MLPSVPPHTKIPLLGGDAEVPQGGVNPPICMWVRRRGFTVGTSSVY